MNDIQTPVSETDACRCYGDDVYSLTVFFRDTVANGEARGQLHSPKLVDLMHCRAVDDFLSYITGLLTLVYQARPQMLKSKNEQLTTDMILQFSTMQELVHCLRNWPCIHWIIDDLRSLPMKH